MPVLKNARHEAFAQSLAKGKTADDAYEDAGYKPDRGNASRMTAKDSIQTRVNEIKGRAAEKAEWTAAARLKMLADIADRVALEDPRSAIAAISEANRMQGSHAPAKVENTGLNGGPIQQQVTHIISPDDIDQAMSKLKSIG